ncbi:3'(2'),5'-bisphosphate nucleotidase CysQ [Sphingomonas sp.]|uniref:3'(2'),5'-bisphosphate nucleotidase CysQ n=1 Tax=Sphingomonas sp. TaxID=28214 RepID=UPI0031D9B104
MNDREVARRVALGAGKVLVALRESSGASGRALGAQGDRASQAYIRRALARLRPDDPILSEESADDRRRLHAGRVWIVDPLDGTREYSEGRADWAVHVALVVDGEPVAGAVALPAYGRVRVSGPAPAGTPCPNPDLTILVSRTRPPEEAARVAARLGAVLVPMGSAGAKTMAVVEGAAHAYLHAGGQYEWDSCAPVAVARAAGLFVARLDGSRPIYNQPNPWMPDLLVCRAEVAARILEALEVAQRPGTRLNGHAVAH